MLSHIDRRSQYKYVVVLAVTTVLLDATITRSSVAAEQPILRFVQWNDTHVSPGLTYTKANEKLDYLIGSVNAETYFPMPNFVIGVGDMINGGALPNLTPDLALLKAKLARLKCPFYPAMGNHEDLQQEGNATYQAPYIAAFGADQVNYTFRTGGIQFVVLDDSGAPMTNGTEMGRTRNEWLRSVLDASPGMPTILCCHIPLVPIREEGVLKKSFGFCSYCAADEDLLKLVDSHSDRIMAVLSGHLHLTGVVRRKGVYHIAVSGTASYPCDFASYEVFTDHIHVRMHSLPQELVTPNTNIHGRPRHKIDYTDAAHPNHESYVRGNSAERDLDIPLPHAPAGTNKG